MPARASAHSQRLALALAAALTCGASPITARGAAAPAVAIPMDAARWRGAHIAFETPEGFPSGVMTVSEGYAELQGAAFGEGAIEFDMKPLAFADTGVLFHRPDADTAEFVYVRADPECPAVNDCVQYAPLTHGRMQWNAYPQYQAGAPIAPKGWNHLRIVVSGERLRLYLNRELSPSLDIPKLLGLSATGGIAVKGPAIFTNVVIRPGHPGNDVPGHEATAVPGTIMAWQLGPTTDPVSGPGARYADIPTSGWRAVETDADGEVNLSRYIPRDPGKAARVAWLKTSVTATEAGERTIDLGFVPRAWLFVNGTLVHAAANFYYPVDKRLAPEGRMASDNAKVRLRLRKGSNEIVIATDDIWRSDDGHLYANNYGWAIEARIEQPTGIVLAGQPR